MNVAQAIVVTLQAAGVQRCYGIVGDTVNRFAHAIHESSIDWIHVRHEEAGAFAAGAEAQLTGQLAVCAGSCGPGSLHFINGLFEANRNRAPVVLIASQIARSDIGFESIQEVDFNDVFRGCSVFCEMILTPEQAQRKTVAACQAALSKRGVAVLIVPVDIASAERTNSLVWRLLSSAMASSEGVLAGVVHTISACSGERATDSVCCVTVTVPTTGWRSS